MSFIEKTSPDCLPPEAYIRLALKCENNTPRFASSYYPKQQPKKTHIKKKKK